MASNAAMRWQKVSNFAKSLAKMQAQLKFSRSLAMGANAPGGANHSRYMAKLRAGAKHGNTIMRILGAKSAVQSSASSAANAMATGLAVTDVENEEDLDNLELWQQCALGHAIPLLLTCCCDCAGVTDGHWYE